MATSTYWLISLAVTLTLLIVANEVSAQNDYVDAIVKRSLPAYACKCCSRYGDESCCLLCSGHRQVRALTFSPFPSDYEDVMKRSAEVKRSSYYPTNLCCRLGIQGCCRQSYYRDYWYNKRSSDFLEPIAPMVVEEQDDEPMSVSKRYPAVLCCRLGIRGCCMYNFYQ